MSRAKYADSALFGQISQSSASSTFAMSPLWTYAGSQETNNKSSANKVHSSLNTLPLLLSDSWLWLDSNLLRKVLLKRQCTFSYKSLKWLKRKILDCYNPNVTIILLSRVPCIVCVFKEEGCTRTETACTKD